MKLLRFLLGIVDFIDTPKRALGDWRSVLIRHILSGDFG